MNATKEELIELIKLLKELHGNYYQATHCMAWHNWANSILCKQDKKLQRQLIHVGPPRDILNLYFRFCPPNHPTTATPTKPRKQAKNIENGIRFRLSFAIKLHVK